MVFLHQLHLRYLAGNEQSWTTSDECKWMIGLIPQQMENSQDRLFFKIFPQNNLDFEDGHYLT